ncbi:ABC transporter substrate-binding protein [Bifidobacterium sp.]|uniref:ABC transporter substrate-binding protein n=1 Tax=Bifidobacterium sp. TaxID=41200 RepID=UPI0025BB11A1|nr:ABC transporter substrate-binding protein [Bifidobacterium sp.]MCH4160285.1 ABC transporter substrate-binding protein [Bifidobacterium sp.]MCH4175198.1 ABC transporter substrate-binding protein [Bifidobacterium sp.]MCI1634853.1 ABC transporter substrate-binding protein [Bifidobacterium sp.]
MMKKRIAMRISAALVAAATLFGVAACGNSSANSSSGSASSSELLLGGDSGTPTFVKNFNPFATNKRVGTNYIYEPLMVMNPVDGKMSPFLAKSYKVVDSKTVQYTLRDGVKWQDGKALTTDDVLFSFNLMKKYAALDSLGVWQRMSDISASGDVITIKFKTDDVPAVSIVSQQLIVPEHIWKDVKDPVKWTNTDPVGTGPYKVGTFNPNQYTMTKSTTYWQANKVAAATLVLPASNTQMDIVSKGYDWAYAYMTDVKKTWLSKNSKNAYWFPAAGVISLYPNLTKAPFNDVNFRQGLNYALDRDAIAKNAEEGYMDSAGQNGLILPGQNDWVSSDIPNKGKITQSTKTALEYFKKAGYTQQDGKLVDSSGKQVELTITTANGYSDWLRGVQTVQKQLSAIGISVKLTQPQPAAYNQALNNGDFDLAVGGFGGNGSVYQAYNTLLNSEYALPVGTATTSNFQRYKNADVDTLLTKFRATTNTSDQKEIINQLQKVVYNEVPVLAMFYGGSWGLFNSDKFTGWPSEDDPYSLPVPYAQCSLLILTHLKKA